MNWIGSTTAAAGSVTARTMYVRWQGFIRTQCLQGQARPSFGCQRECLPGCGNDESSLADRLHPLPCFQSQAAYFRDEPTILELVEPNTIAVAVLDRNNSHERHQ